MKHIHCDLIKAWADGAEIQCLANPTKDPWWINCNNPQWDEKVQYRIKPEARKYRVSLHLIGKNYVTSTSENEAESLYKEGYSNFIKWLTDWIEYEI